MCQVLTGDEVGKQQEIDRLTKVCSVMRQALEEIELKAIEEFDELDGTPINREDVGWFAGYARLIAVAALSEFHS